MIARAIAERDVLIVDGGLATELERRGSNLNDSLWSARLIRDDPALIEAVHLDYLRAGADVLITASYQATIPGLCAAGLSESEARGVIAESVRIARRACERFHSESSVEFASIVAGSAGAYGAYLADGSEFRGNYGLSKSALKEFHKPRIEVLIEAGADCIACETIPSLLEGEALVEAIEELGLVGGAWISFSCADGDHLNEGQRFCDAVAMVSESDAVAAIGINCTAPEHVAPLLFSARDMAKKPFVVYPNSGEAWDDASRSWGGRHSEVDFAERARDWYAQGARLIGGCCRTTPDTIRAIRLALSARGV